MPSVHPVYTRMPTNSWLLDHTPHSRPSIQLVMSTSLLYSSLLPWVCPAFCSLQGHQRWASPPQNPQPSGNHDKKFTKPLLTIFIILIVKVLIRFLHASYKILVKYIIHKFLYDSCSFPEILFFCVVRILQVQDTCKILEDSYILASV